MKSVAYRVATTVFLALYIATFRMPGAARAASVSTYDACMKIAEATVAMETCQIAEENRLDALVAHALAKALADLPADQQAKLRASQRLWVAFRIKDCDVFYGSQTGTIASIQAGGCAIAHANQRLRDLADFLPEDH